MVKVMKDSVALILAILLFSGTAMADDQFGLGIMLGEPTGVNGKYFIDKYNALDAALGWSLFGDNDFHIHADYLYHIYSLTDSGMGEAPVYFGLGARAVFRNDKDNQAGFRFPVGVDHLFTSVPFDVFVEIVPILNVAPDTDFDMEGVVGARFFF